MMIGIEVAIRLEGVDTALSRREQVPELSPAGSNFLRTFPVVGPSLIALVAIPEQPSIRLDRVDHSFSGREDMDEMAPTVTNFQPAAPFRLGRGIRRVEMPVPVEIANTVDPVKHA